MRTTPSSRARTDSSTTTSTLRSVQLSHDPAPLIPQPWRVLTRWTTGAQLEHAKKAAGSKLAGASRAASKGKGRAVNSDEDSDEDEDDASSTRGGKAAPKGKKAPAKKKQVDSEDSMLDSDDQDQMSSDPPPAKRGAKKAPVKATVKKAPAKEQQQLVSSMFVPRRVGMKRDWALTSGGSTVRGGDER